MIPIMVNSGDPPISWKDLGEPLRHISQAIEGSRSLLELQDNWDDEGSPAISEATWKRAVEFLARYAKWAWENRARVIDAPDILPGPDGGVDLHWDRPDYELLISIPTDVGATACFYGDDRGSISIKGTFDPDRANHGILEWLIKPNRADGAGDPAEVSSVSPRPEEPPEEEARPWRGVFAVRYERKPLLRQPARINLQELRRWTPQVSLTRRMIETDDE